MSTSSGYTTLTLRVAEPFTEAPSLTTAMRFEGRILYDIERMLVIFLASSSPHRDFTIVLSELNVSLYTSHHQPCTQLQPLLHKAMLCHQKRQ